MRSPSSHRVFSRAKRKGPFNGSFPRVLISGELIHNRVMSQTLLNLFTTADLIDAGNGTCALIACYDVGAVVGDNSLWCR
jgi:hypothetical protein